MIRSSNILYIDLIIFDIWSFYMLVIFSSPTDSAYGKAD